MFGILPCELWKGFTPHLMYFVTVFFTWLLFLQLDRLLRCTWYQVKAWSHVKMIFLLVTTRPAVRVTAINVTVSREILCSGEVVLLGCALPCCPFHHLLPGKLSQVTRFSAVHLSCTEWNEFRLLSAGLSTFVVRGEGKGLIPQSVAWASWGMLLLQRGKEWSCPQRRREEIQHVGCRSVQPTAGMLRPSTWLCSISFVVWSHPSRKVLEVFCNCFFFFSYFRYVSIKPDSRMLINGTNVLGLLIDMLLKDGFRLISTRTASSDEKVECYSFERTRRPASLSIAPNQHPGSSGTGQAGRSQVQKGK